MKKVRQLIYLVSFCLPWFPGISHTAQQSGFGEEQRADCTEVRIEYSDQTGLNREQRLRQMDSAFFDSLNRAESCRPAENQADGARRAMGGGGKSGGGDTGGDGGGETKEVAGAGDGPESKENMGAGQSVASKALSGPEAAREKQSQNGPLAGDIEGIEAPPTGQMTEGRKSGRDMMANGRTPADIPSAENDDALAAQIRYAAENEADSVKSRQLWNEYRKYKGLPEK